MTDVAQKSFRLKADMVALTVMQLQSTELTNIAAELKTTIARAPKFFHQAPLLIDVQGIDANSLNIKDFLSLFADQSVLPIGIRGLNEQQQAVAAELGIACMQSSSSVDSRPSEVKKVAAESKQTARVMTKAVRSGTKVYAKDQDLIVIGPVNVGAECIADGNIHVYGPLRGRALAGATGNAEARIFCHELEAELIAIAGHYLVRENLDVPKKHAGMLQVFLKNNKLSIESI